MLIYKLSIKFQKMSSSKTSENKLIESIQSKIRNVGRLNLDKAIASEMIHGFGKELGIIGARVWEVKNKKYTELIVQEGGRKELRSGLTIDTNYEQIQQALKNDISVMDTSSPDYNKNIEETIGSFSSILIKLSPKKLLSLEVDDIEKVKSSLQLIKVAIDTSIEKYELEDITKFASKIQKSLLPKKESITLQKYYDIAWYAKPKKKKVGGDLLVFKEPSKDENNLIIAIGDARGKGISAATVTLSTYFGLDVATEFNPRGTVLMERLNRALYNCSITQEFISLFYAVLHKNGSIRYNNAGHPYPLILHNSYTEKLDKGGTILGIIKDSKYEPGVANLEVNDILFLYTDGLSEITNHNSEELGINGLENIINKYKDKSSRIIKQNVLEESKNFMHKKNFQDDVTFAIIKKIK